MAIANVLLGLVFGVEMVLYAMLGANVAYVRTPLRQQVADNNLINVNQPPNYAQTVAPNTATCILKSGSNRHCIPCLNGTRGGIIQSPNYPNDYKKVGNVRCSYLITVSDEHYVQMTLLPRSNVDIFHSNKLNFRDNNGHLIWGTNLNPSLTFPTNSSNTYTSTVRGPAEIHFSGHRRSTCIGICKWEVTFMAV